MKQDLGSLGLFLSWCTPSSHHFALIFNHDYYAGQVLGIIQYTVYLTSHFKFQDWKSLWLPHNISFLLFVKKYNDNNSIYRTTEASVASAPFYYHLEDVFDCLMLLCWLCLYCFLLHLLLKVQKITVLIWAYRFCHLFIYCLMSKLFIHVDTTVSGKSDDYSFELLLFSFISCRFISCVHYFCHILYIIFWSHLIFWSTKNKRWKSFLC